MRILTGFFFVFTLVTSYCQDAKKLIKLLDYEVVEMDGQKDYSWKPNGEFNAHLSWTLKDDTVGVSNNKEYLQFRDSVYFYKNESFKLFRGSYVSNVEYQLFIDWALDSVMREKIFMNTDDNVPEKLVLKILDLPEEYYDTVKKAWIETKELSIWTKRLIASFDYDFDWRKKLPEKFWTPLISDFYLRPNERFNRRRDMDRRKFNYSLGRPVLGFDMYHINISQDLDTWAQKSENIHDIYYNMAKYYGTEDCYNDHPVQGLTGTQAKAYLIFLERQMQAQINEKNLPYNVRLSFPTEEEIKEAEPNYKNQRAEFSIQEKNVTEQWRITNSEYEEFCLWVQDSIIREMIYLNMNSSIPTEESAKLLDSDGNYYDEVNMRYANFDAAQPFINRGLFHLNYDFDWEKKFTYQELEPAIGSLLEDGEFKIAKMHYGYYWEDIQRRSLLGDLKWEESQYSEQGGEYYAQDEWIGKDLIQSCGVRDHEDRSRFIIEEAINVYPTVKCVRCNVICVHQHGDLFADPNNPIRDTTRCPDDEKTEWPTHDFSSEPDALIQGLSYYQALAFYHWKYNRTVPYTKGDLKIYEDLVPSQEQFEKIQKGETIVLPAKKIPYPDPLFRYVIHVYPK